MKKLILASLAIVALASCSKESSMDANLASAQLPIKYSTYAGSATTKGKPINTNAEFAVENAAFEVSAYALVGSGSVGKYFNFSTVTCDNSNSWKNTDATYWPNSDATLYLGAYYPSASQRVSDDAEYKYDSGHSLIFNYIVNGDVYPSVTGAPTPSSVLYQEDLMYAVTEKSYIAPNKGESPEDASADSEKVNLHFKHALTQIGFTATKDSDIEVVVESITLCNVMSSGDFSATKVTDDNATDDGGSDPDDSTVEDGYVKMDNTCDWSSQGDIAHYKVFMSGGASSIAVGSDKTDLSDESQVLMLVPQALTAWNDADSDTDDIEGLDNALKVIDSNDSYLAIECKIKHVGGVVNIIDGVVFVKFSTEDIQYESGDSAVDEWLPGYKITYNLHFGGGYVDPTPGTTDPEIPEPGKTPDPDDLVPTLRPISYTTTVDAFETAVAGPASMNL